jgi:hypothetical protein
MTEEWKDIPSLAGKYQASNLGRIRYVRVLKALPTANTDYLAVTLTHGERKQERIAVHVLVGYAFLGPRPEHKQINHIDGNRQNNRPVNLEYVTVQENSHHAFKLGNRKHYFTDKQMDTIARWFFDEGRSNTDISRGLLGKKYTVQQLRQMRKKVRSVIEIWRAGHRNGRKNPYERKLTPERVEHMRKLRAAGAKQSELAELFHVHPAHVSRVLAGQMWKQAQ